jgi:hypothetical protein
MSNTCVIAKDTLTELQELCQLLLCLPESLPRASFTFRQWAPKGEYPDEELNQHLKRKFGSRVHGLKFTSRAPGVVAVVDLLEKHLCQSLENIILKKWVEDLNAGAKALGVVRTSGKSRSGVARVKLRRNHGNLCRYMLPSCRSCFFRS